MAAIDGAGWTGGGACWAHTDEASASSKEAAIRRMIFREENYSKACSVSGQAGTRALPLTATMSGRRLQFALARWAKTRRPRPHRLGRCVLPPRCRRRHRARGGTSRTLVMKRKSTGCGHNPASRGRLLLKTARRLLYACCRRDAPSCLTENVYG